MIYDVTIRARVRVVQENEAAGIQLIICDNSSHSKPVYDTVKGWINMNRFSYVVNELTNTGSVIAPSPGDVCLVTSSDVSIGVVIPDSLAAPGTAGSGFIADASPAKNGMVTITATVTNAAGVVIGTATVPATISSTGPVPVAAGVGIILTPVTNP